MKVRIILLAFGALLLAILIAVVMQHFVNKADKNAQKADTTILVLVSSTELTPGTVISLDKLAWKEWPIKSLSPQYITKNKTEELNSIKGAVVRYTILANEPVRLGNLVRLDGKSILSAVIQSGMRGVTIPYGKIANAPSFIAPGDIVDIVIPKRSQGNLGGYFGQTIIKAVRVIAVDHSLQNLESNKSVTPKTITLEVNAEQAEDLAASIREGDIVISMRSAFSDHADKLAPPAPIEVKSADKKSWVVTMIRGKEKSEVILKE